MRKPLFNSCARTSGDRSGHNAFSQNFFRQPTPLTKTSLKDGSRFVTTKYWVEDSLRVPFQIRWPGVTQPGSHNRGIASNVDFAETFLQLAGLDVRSDIQGRSLVPLFQEKPLIYWRKSFYYHYHEFLDAHRIRRRDSSSHSGRLHSAPRVNMSFSPLAGKTCNLEFTMARFDNAGHELSPAIIAVRHLLQPSA